ncbi:MAG: hypothetical protein ACT4ON_06045 [Bacteroidota bacterium]
MKKLILLSCSLLAVLAFTFNSCSNKQQAGAISFYEVPLVCGAAPEIGCGSRIKPLFIDTEKEKQIKESWSNREGTVIAIVWNETDKNARENLIQPLFKKHTIDAKLIADSDKITGLTASLTGKDQWYKGMDVDKLSLEEAGVIAETMTEFAKKDGLINVEEAAAIKKDMEDYFKKELVLVRTCDELKSEETQEKWRKDGYNIYAKHIGKERADSVSVRFMKIQEDACKKESACTKEGKKDCCKKK